jgi:hypothetical protein
MAPSLSARAVRARGVISVAKLIQQTGAANLSAEGFDVLVLAQS